MKEENIKLPANVILIDVAYLNFLIGDIKRYFEQKLERTLQDLDLASFVEYLALDFGYEVGNNETQVLLVYDDSSPNICFCQPSDIKKDLDGKAFASQLGEFMFAGVPCENIVGRDELLLDLTKIVLNSDDVKRFILIGSDASYDNRLIEELNGADDKQVLQYRMDESTEKIEYRWELIVFPIMQAVGIREDEL